MDTYNTCGSAIVLGTVKGVQFPRFIKRFHHTCMWSEVLEYDSLDPRLSSSTEGLGNSRSSSGPSSQASMLDTRCSLLLTPMMIASRGEGAIEGGF